MSVSTTHIALPLDGNNELKDSNDNLQSINIADCQFPCCIVWTPIPILTWLIPMIGHMGIGMSNGVIRDFAGPYYVSEDNMAFGKPTRYLHLHPKYVEGGKFIWDEAVTKASILYSSRMHNLICDNCHSHVATALNIMQYKGYSHWNMVILAIWLFFCARYVGIKGFLKTWLPFFVILVISILITYFMQFN